MRIARALATTALASSALLIAAPAAVADSAEVTPGTVSPGGTVTVSVSCDATSTSPVPDTITANSQAFDQGAVQLTRVPAASGTGVAGPAYRGTAKIASADKFTATGTNAVGPRSTWSVDGNCPGGGQWKASFTVATSSPTASSSPTQPAVRGGVGGSFTDSGTTMIIGGVLVAVAVGATCVVFRRRGRHA